jgi:hypothetical protein
MVLLQDAVVIVVLVLSTFSRHRFVGRWYCCKMKW